MHSCFQSFMGKVFGGFCAVLGVFTLTLPIPIVVNSFAGFYKNRLWRNEVAQKMRQRMEEKKKLKRKSCTGDVEEENIDMILTLESREALAKVLLFQKKIIESMALKQVLDHTGIAQPHQNK